MSNYRRAQCSGGTFFFTLVTFDRRRLFASPVARRLLKESWSAVLAKWPFRVDAICLLPEHLHCMMTLPENEGDYALRWRAIKGRFSRAYRKLVDIEEIPQSVSRHRRGNLPVWQRRYWEHLIHSDEDYRLHVDYIHYNPVKHGLVSCAIEYPWSSFRRYVKMGVYDPDWGMSDEATGRCQETGE